MFNLIRAKREPAGFVFFFMICRKYPDNFESNRLPLIIAGNFIISYYLFLFTIDGTAVRRPVFYSTGSRDGVVVRALISHQSGPGLIPGLGVICGLSLLLVHVLASRGFSPGTLVFSSPRKAIFPNSSSIWRMSILQGAFDHLVMELCAVQIYKFVHLLYHSSCPLIDPYHSAAMLSLGGIKSFVFAKASLGQTRIQCEARRAKTKLFILLRLNMAAVW